MRAGPAAVSKRTSPTGCGLRIEAARGAAKARSLEQRAPVPAPRKTYAGADAAADPDAGVRAGDREKSFAERGATGVGQRLGGRAEFGSVAGEGR